MAGPIPITWWTVGTASTLLLPDGNDTTTADQWLSTDACTTATSDSPASGYLYLWPRFYGQDLTPVAWGVGQADSNASRSGASLEVALRGPPENVERERARVDVVRHDREAAERRALELLESHLTAEQRRQLERLRAFRVVARSGRVYEIDAEKRMHNVYELDGQGRRVNELCIYQRGALPLADNTLAQKLMLEADEAEFRRIANHTRLSPAGA